MPQNLQTLENVQGFEFKKGSWEVGVTLFCAPKYGLYRDKNSVVPSKNIPNSLMLAHGYPCWQISIGLSVYQTKLEITVQG